MSSHMRSILKKFFVVCFLLGYLFLAQRFCQKTDSLIYVQAFNQTSYLYCDASNVKYGHNDQHKIKTVTYIVVHSTDNPNADNNAHIKWLNRDKRANAVHYYVDANGVVKALDESIQAWGVGDAKPNQATIRNDNSIQIEICEYTDATLQEQAISNAIIFIQDNLLKRYPNAQIVKHQDASGKYCPRVLLNQKDGWVQFLARIQKIRL